MSPLTSWDGAPKVGLSSTIASGIYDSRSGSRASRTYYGENISCGDRDRIRSRTSHALTPFYRRSRARETFVVSNAATAYYSVTAASRSESPSPVIRSSTWATTASISIGHSSHRPYSKWGRTWPTSIRMTCDASHSTSLYRYRRSGWARR